MIAYRRTISIYTTSENVPEYFIKSDTIYRIITDHLGSVRQVVNTVIGEIIQKIDYDEYGNVFFDSRPGFTPFGYAGGLYDGHTKLVRFGARDYDAITGRWTAKDPIKFNGGNNQVIYVSNDPINFADSKGYIAGSINSFANASAAISSSNNQKTGDALEIAADILASIFSLALGDVSGAVFNAVETIPKVLANDANAAYPKKAGKVEAHHFYPKYLNGPKDGPKILMPAAYHQKITNAFRKEWAYGKGKPTPQELYNILLNVYSKFPLR